MWRANKWKWKGKAGLSSDAVFFLNGFAIDFANRSVHGFCRFP
jgi:hypothetical protein